MFGQPTIRDIVGPTATTGQCLVASQNMFVGDLSCAGMPRADRLAVVQVVVIVTWTLPAVTCCAICRHALQ
jgi:hypothetical protein